MIHQYAEPDEAGISMLRIAMEKLSLSARAYNRILKVAHYRRPRVERKSADRTSCQAISYRNLDRGDWAGAECDDLTSFTYPQSQMLSFSLQNFIFATGMR